MITLSELRTLKSRRDFEEFVAERFDSDINDFLAGLDAGMNMLLRSNLKQAGEFASSAQQLRTLVPECNRPRIISLRARWYAWSGDSRRAIKTYKTALSLFLKHRDFFAAARLRKGLVEVHMYLGQYDQAQLLKKC